MVSGVRAIDEHVAFLLVKLRDEYRNAVSNKCQPCFRFLGRLPARLEARIPGSKSCPEAVGGPQVHVPVSPTASSLILPGNTPSPAQQTGHSETRAVEVRIQDRLVS